MTNQQILSTLRQAGFIVNYYADGVKVTLNNRKVYRIEVEIVLVDVPREVIYQLSDGVLVCGIDFS